MQTSAVHPLQNPSLLLCCAALYRAHVFVFVSDDDDGWCTCFMLMVVSPLQTTQIVYTNQTFTYFEAITSSVASRNWNYLDYYGANLFLIVLTSMFIVIGNIWYAYYYRHAAISLKELI